MNELDLFRQQYPQYADMDDQSLASNIHKTFYPEMSEEEYYTKLNRPDLLQGQQSQPFRTTELEPEETGVSGILKDIWSGVKGAPGYALEGAKQLGSGLYDMAGGNAPPKTTRDILLEAFGRQSPHEEQYGYSPKRFKQATLTGLLEGGRILGNAPGNALNYFKEKELLPQGVPDITLPDYINEFDYANKTGLEGQRPGDIIPRGLGSFAPSLSATLGNPYAAMSLHATGREENPVKEMLAGLIGQKVIKTAAKLPTVKIEKVSPTKLGEAYLKSELPGAKFARRYSQDATVENLAKDIGKKTSVLKKEYNNIFETPGVAEEVFYEPSKIDIKKLEANAPAFLENFHKFKETNNTLDAHWAQSDLGKYIRSIEKKGTNATPAQIAAMKSARVIRKDLQSLIEDALNSSENPNLAKSYEKTGKKYAEEFGDLSPALEKDLELFNKNKLPASEVMKTLQNKGQRVFRHTKGKEYPGIRKALKESYTANLLSELPFSSKVFEYIKRENK